MKDEGCSMRACEVLNARHSARPCCVATPTFNRDVSLESRKWDAPSSSRNPDAKALITFRSTNRLWFMPMDSCTHAGNHRMHTLGTKFALLWYTPSMHDCGHSATRDKTRL
jgi:hypothetical protein